MGRVPASWDSKNKTERPTCKANRLDTNTLNAGLNPCADKLFKPQHDVVRIDVGDTRDSDR